MSETEKQELLDHVEGLKAKSRRRFRFALAAVSIGSFCVLTLMLARLQTDEGSSGHEATQAQEAPPKTATEIIAQEFAGEIEKGHEPPPGSADAAPAIPRNDPSIPDLREEEEETETAEAAPAPTPEKSRKPASIPSNVMKVTFDKSAVKVSKNLDKKKVVSYLGEKLSKANCWPAQMPKAKSIKAVININKTGGLGKIHVTPADKSDGKIASCIKQKLGPSAKALKPKNKTVAEITVQLKVSR